MAKKKEKKLEYLQSALPEGEKASMAIKLDWTVLDKRNTLDSGAMSAECNISADDTPYITPVRCWEKHFRIDENESWGLNFNDVLSFVGGIKNNGSVGDFEGDTAYTACIEAGNYAKIGKITIPFKYQTGATTREGTKEYTAKSINFLLGIGEKLYIFLNGCIYVDGLAFVIGTTRYNEKVKSAKAGISMSGTMGVNAKAEQRILILNEDNELGALKCGDNDFLCRNCRLELYQTEESDYILPEFDYITVFNSRLFGVGNGFIYVSEYNDFSGWTLDTEEAKASNAWMSASQSNDVGLGGFTGITAYQGHVICFKKDSIQEIYNSSNPFRVVDVAYGEGCIDHRSIKEVKGLLFYASETGIKVYNGANPKSVSDNLLLSNLTEAVGGSDGNNYYVYCKCADGSQHFYVYNVLFGRWSERALVLGASETGSGEVKEFVPKQFATNDSGLYMLTQDNEVYHLSENYDIDWSFETDFMTNKTVNIKHIKKIQLYAEVDEGAEFDVYFLYDNEEFNAETSHHVYSSGDRTGKIPVRVKPRSTAHYGFKIHVCGHGFVKLYQAEILFTEGGELFG